MNRKILVALLLCALLIPVFGTNIKVPSLELSTRIYGYDGELIMVTDAQMDIVIEGGYKFGGKIVLGFDGAIAVPGFAQSLPPVTFQSVSMVVRDILGSPLDFTYFVGTNDYVCYGDDFTNQFGTPFIQSTYRATYQTLPLPGVFINKEYKGLHRINGNGIKLAYFAPDKPFGFAWYLYQDHNFIQSIPLLAGPMGTIPIINSNIYFYDTGLYSTDLRFLINTESVKLEIYAGGTVDTKYWDMYMRAGGLLYLGFGPVEILLAGGVPRLDFTQIGGLEMFYILFESRFNLGPVNITPTIFFRPAQYLQQDFPAEAEKIDFNLNIGIFNPRRDFMSFGAEGNLTTQGLELGTTTYQLRVLPYIKMATPGVYWEIKVSFLVMDSTQTLDASSFLSNIQGLIYIKA
jgi:hypothetical protein